METSKKQCDLFYLPTVCHVCKNYSEDLKRCSKCKLMAYCSTEHQKIHWKDHKEFCKMAEKLLKNNGLEKFHIFDMVGISKLNTKEWTSIRLSMKNIFEEKLNRRLINIEDQIWMYPRVCEICRLSQQNKLFDCIICYSASYCSTAHKLKHEYIHDKFCKQLETSYEINKILFDGLQYPQIKTTKINNEFPEDITEFINKYTELTPNFELAYILASEKLSPALTILYSVLCPTNAFKFKKDVMIHLIGSSRYERSFDWPALNDVIINNTSIQTLNIVLIGPETEPFEIYKEDSTIKIHFYSKLYHEYIYSDFFTTPDIIVAFNCGFHEFQDSLLNDTWIESIGNLFTLNFGLFILTSYTEKEAIMDLNRLLHFVETENNMEVILKCVKNKFASLAPIRDWENSDIPVFYNNNYLSVIKNTSY